MLASYFTRISFSLIMRGVWSQEEELRQQMAEQNHSNAKYLIGYVACNTSQLCVHERVMLALDSAHCTCEFLLCIVRWTLQAITSCFHVEE